MKIKLKDNPPSLKQRILDFSKYKEKHWNISVRFVVK